MIVKDYQGYVLSGFGNPGYGAFSEHRFADFWSDASSTIGKIGKAVADVFGPTGGTPTTGAADPNASKRDAEMAALQAQIAAQQQAALLAQAGKKDNTMLYVAGGVGVLLVMGLMFSRK